MDNIISCFVKEDPDAIEDTYNYYQTELHDRWDSCQRRILAMKIDFLPDVGMVRSRLLARISLTNNDELIEQMKDVIRHAKDNIHPINIENELQKILPINQDEDIIDLTWNKAGVIKQQFGRLLKEYIPYIDAKFNKIERVWKEQHKIAVDTILKTLIYIAHLDCGYINPSRYATFKINDEKINLSDEIWESIYPIFENEHQPLYILDGLMNGLIFINISTKGCPSDIIRNELIRLTKTKEVFFNLDYLRQLHHEMLNWNYDVIPPGKSKAELIELRNEYGYDLLINVAMIGFYLLLHNGYIPYHHGHIDDELMKLSLTPYMIDWDSYYGEVYQIINIFFKTKSVNGTIHNGSHFTNLFGMGYVEFLDKLDYSTINKLAIWYALYILNQLKSIR